MNSEYNSEANTIPAEKIQEEEQDFDYLIQNLVNIVFPMEQGNESSPIQIFVLLKMGLKFIRVHTILLSSLFAFVLLFVNKIEFLLLIVSALGIIIVLAFASSIKYFVEELEKLYSIARLSDRKRMEQSLKKVKKDFISELLAIKKLRDNVKVEKLKFYEIEIDKQIRNTQVNEKVMYNLLLILPISITCILIYVYGNQSFDILSNVLLVPLKLTSIAVYTIIVNVVNSIFFRTELDKLNKCLSCIKKAQVN